MAHKKNFSALQISSASLAKPMLLGAGIGLLFISIFILGVDYSDPSWSQYWQVRPMIIVPLSGAIGGLFYCFMGDLRSRGGWIKAVAIVLSYIGFAVILWLGIVLGLEGTLWD